MSFFRVVNWAVPTLAAGALVLSSCSGDDEQKSSNPNIFGPGGAGGADSGTGGSGGSDSGSAGEAGTGAGGEAGAGGSSGEAGTGGGSGLCGNGVLEADEACDSADFGGETCQTMGFDSGNLVCTNCEVDYAGCIGVERCYDGIDNDNDGIEDCKDDDCATVCTDPCSAPIPLDDPGTIWGSTWTHPDNMATSCSGAGGPDLVFRFTPKVTGVVEAILTSSSADLSLSARAECAQATSELACNDYSLGPGAVEHIIVPAQQGVPVYLVVDGVGPGEDGSFELEAVSRPTVCGDGTRDPNEECDDGNELSNDGCSADCKLELSEAEPNDDVGTANPVSERFIGAIDPAGDVDVVSVVVNHPGSNFAIFVRDLGDQACSKELMDPVVEVYRDGGATLVAEDDDSGEGYCSTLMVTGLEPDTYYVFVRGAGAAAPTFPYQLDVFVDRCGNTMKSLAEECDDGNTQPGDGCSPDCTWE